MPVSGKDMRKLFLKQGYSIEKGAGKGSHWKLKRKGDLTVTIPDHKELSRGLEHALKKLLKKVSK